MAAARSLGKSALLAIAICAILSLQGAEAQNNTTTGVPGWGIAVLVMLSLLLLGCICSCGIVPVMCRGGGDGGQSGFVFQK